MALNIYQKINEVRKLISYVKKNSSVSTGGGSYKAVTHDQVTGMVREHMVSQGIVCYPFLIDSISNPRVGDAKQFMYEATYDFVFVNVDEPEDQITIRIQAHAMDNADKAPGKALSYAKKYAVLKLFEIETGEDEESRYQSDDFDIEEWSEIMNTATSREELKPLFLQAKAEVMKLKKPAPSLKQLNQVAESIGAKFKKEKAE